MDATTTLVLYFKRAGIIAGPSRKQTRHSDLSTIKTWLIGDPVSFGYRASFNFGSAVHYRWLLKKLGSYTLTLEEKGNLDGMIRSLEKNALATKLLSDAPTREQRIALKLNGIAFGGTPDARGKKHILDLKTTVCANLKSFIQKAFEYGYFRQGVTYMLITGTKQYYIIGIQKSYPYQVYIVWLQSPEFKDWIDYATEELKFLLYFYKNYGTPKYRKASR